MNVSPGCFAELRQRHSFRAPKACLPAGFTLIEVLVALAVVALALAAGSQAVHALARNAQRQSDVMLAQICAENEMARLRLLQQMSTPGERSSTCVQAGVALQVTTTVTTTLNPNFQRIEVQIKDAGQWSLLHLASVQGRH